MTKPALRLSFLRLCGATLATLLFPALTPSTIALQLPASSAISHPAEAAPVRIDHAVHIVGPEGKREVEGELALDGTAITFRTGGHSTAIPLESVLMFSVADDDRPLIRGTKGKLAEAAPYGAGFAVTMTRPSVDTLTLFYKDASGAVHGCVLALPKGAKGQIVSALAVGKLSPADYPKSGELMVTEHAREIGKAQVSGLSKPSIEVALPSETIDGVPSSFAAAVYEDVIGELTKSGLFAHVWRTGDMGETADSLVLRINVENWKKGSPRKRGFGPFAGATVIESSVTLKDGLGRTVFDGKVNGTKRLKGESLEAASSLAKHVKKALEKSPELQSKKQEGR